MNQEHFDDNHFDSIEYNNTNTQDHSYVGPDKSIPVSNIKQIDFT